jgi:hypothetical protein
MDIELRYWPKDKPIPEGWVYHDGLEGTHHGVGGDRAGFMLIVKVG